MRKLAFLLALAVPALAAPAPAQAQRAPAAIDWTSRVEVTAEGGYRMGNPDAAMKLVEYGSITCSHCADFELEQGQAIRDQVRTGRVSFEYRPFVIFPSDPGIFMLLSCQAPERVFQSMHALYRTNAEWSARLEASGAQIEAEIRRGSYAAAMPAIVRLSGTDAHFREQGMTDRQIAACLADQSKFDRLSTITREAQARGVRGTPTFFLNGRLLDVAGYSDVTAALRQP